MVHGLFRETCRDQLCYEYKYIIDGEWTYNEFELVTTPNKDDHVNNFLHIVNNDPNSVNATVRRRLTSEDPDLTKEERVKIRQLLESYPDEDRTENAIQGIL